MRKSHAIAAVAIVLAAVAFGACFVEPVQAADPKKEDAQAAKKTEAPAEHAALEVLQKDRIDGAVRDTFKRFENVVNRISPGMGSLLTEKAVGPVRWGQFFLCGLILVGVAIVNLIVRVILGRARRRIEQREGEPTWKSLILEGIVGPISLFIWVYGLYAAVSPLFNHFRQPDGDNPLRAFAGGAADIGGLIAVIWLLYRLVIAADKRMRVWAGSTPRATDEMLVDLTGRILRILVLILGGVLIVQNVTGIQMGPLVASLGIGGIAVALAAKDFLANFFGTVTVLTDKPFDVGDRVVVDGFDGIVESVGLRSTKIRTLDGHQVSVPNEKIMVSSLENIGRRTSIKWSTNIGVRYETPPDKVESAVRIIEEILADHEGMDEATPPRVFFNGFNDSSLNIGVTAWYHPPDWWNYQAWLQKTCLEIMRRFEAEGIEFAFPSGTVYLSNDGEEELKLAVIAGKDIPVTAQATS